MARAGTVVYNGHEYSVESTIGKLAVQFEQPGYRPEQHPYPRMMYKAQKCQDGVVRCDAGAPAPRHVFANEEAYKFALQRDEAFDASCRREIGRDMRPEAHGGPLPRQVCDAQHAEAFEMGWRDSADEAIALVMQREAEIFKAAAELEAKVAGMSQKAQAEVRAAQAATPNVLGEIPEQPTKRVHWKTRQAMERKASAA